MKIAKSKILSERFEYVGRNILQAGNTTAKSKYNLVKDWKQPETGDDLRSFVSFCNFYARFIPMFQIQCNPLRDLYTRRGKGKIPVPAWMQNLWGIFNSLKYSIVSSPLLTRFISSKPLFLKIDGSATGMGYNLIQPDDNTEARTATSKLLNRGECDFDLSSDGTRLRPVLFNIRSYTATEKHCHSFVG